MTNLIFRPTRLDPASPPASATAPSSFSSGATTATGRDAAPFTPEIER
jgi:hypothetical protein